MIFKEGDKTDKLLFEFHIPEQMRTARHSKKPKRFIVVSALSNVAGIMDYCCIVLKATVIVWHPEILVKVYDDTAPANAPSTYTAFTS